MAVRSAGLSFSALRGSFAPMRLTELLLQGLRPFGALAVAAEVRQHHCAAKGSLKEPGQAVVLCVLHAVALA